MEEHTERRSIYGEEREREENKEENKEANKEENKEETGRCLTIAFD